MGVFPALGQVQKYQTELINEQFHIQQPNKDKTERPVY